MVAQKLAHYFQGHPIMVVIQAPLSDIIGNQDATGQVAKWAIELSTRDIRYEPCKAIKSQPLTDFIAKWTEAQSFQPHEQLDHWVMYFNGSNMLIGSGVGVVLISPKGNKLNYVLQIHFAVSNNVA